MSQGVNYLDLIKNPSNTAGKSTRTLQNNNMKENTWISQSPSPQSATFNAKKSKNQESDCLGELDIRQLTNTRRKHHNHKELLANGNMGLISKETQQKQYQLQQCQNNNQHTLMQNSYLFRKNQQSPLVYNREAERFSYINDPMLGQQQLQDKNISQTQISSQQFQGVQQMQNNWINSSKQQQHQQYLNNYPYPPNCSQPQQWQYLPSSYNNLTAYQQDFSDNYINNNYQQSQYQNNHKSYQEPLIRHNLSSLNNEIHRMQLEQNKQQQQQQQLHYLDSITSTDSFGSFGHEDSFGNVKKRNNNNNHMESNLNTAANLNKYYNEQKYQQQNISKNPYSYQQQQQTPDLQRYYRKPIGQNKSTGQGLRKLLPQFNISTVVFIILACYVVYKNFGKIKGAAETIQYYVFQGTTTTSNRSNKSNDNNHNIYAQSSQENITTKYTNSQEFEQKQQKNQDGNNISEQMRQENQDAVIAKAFAKELIKELFMQLSEKKKVYRDEYEDNLSQRFSIHMLREILPELNKVLLNSREIRVQFDGIKRSEYYELNNQS